MAWILRIRRKWVTLFRPKHTEKAEEDMEDRWLTVDEICEYLDISRNTIYKWIIEKALPAYRLGRQWKFKAEEVDEWVRTMSSTLTGLSKETEQLINEVDKIEKTKVVNESKRTPASKKKAPAKKKARPLTSTDQIVKTVNRHGQEAEEDIFEDGLSLDEAVKDYEKRLILEALEKSNWVKARAARFLNINRTTLVEKIKKQNLTKTSSP